MRARPWDLHGYCRQVGVVVVSGHLDGVRGTVHGPLQRALVQVELGLGHRLDEPAVAGGRLSSARTGGIVGA